MIKLTKFSLKRPVTLILLLVTVLYFGIQSILSSPMELTPDMNMPMQIIYTVYPGAAPEDINELITKPIEGNVSTLAGVDTVASTSAENISMVVIQYDYGTNMDTAYMNLRKSLDTIKSKLPEDAQEPTIYEIDINSTASMNIAVSGGTDENLYNYVNDAIVPELEKISSVGEVSVSGGQSSYIKIELIPEKLSQYNLNLSTIAQLITAADFSLPSGTVKYGTQDLNLTIGDEYRDIESIRNIVLPLQTGDVIHLSDVAVVSNTLKEKTSISRYNSEDVVAVRISKQQKASAVTLSRAVQKTLNELQKTNSTLNFKIVYDASDSIISALSSVFKTLLIAVVLAMIVLFVFFGDWKASVIVGSSIPVSVLVALTLMGAAGFSLNIVSVGSLALGVGMVVDNSIVVVESCFRAKEKMDYKEAAIEGTKIVIGSIFGSTATTCVVFLPLALLQGLTGQLFKQLGFTIVFCMAASFLSAIMIVPLLYYWVKPVEKKESPVGKFMTRFQNGYRDLVGYIIPQKKKVIIVTVLLLVLSFVMLGQLGFELMPEVDEGMIEISAQVKPGIDVEEADRIATKIEKFVSEQPDVEEYLLTYGSGGTSIMGTGSGNTVNVTAYLKDNRSKKTKDVIKQWKRELTQFPDTSIDITSSSSTGMNMLNSSSSSVNLQSTDYDLLKKTADDIVADLHNEPFITQVHSSAENAAPVIKVKVDPVKAESIGLTPASVAGMVYSNMTGKEVLNFTSNGSEVSVMLENPDWQYKKIDDVKGMLIPTMTGATVPLQDIAEVSFVDSAKSISRSDKQYQVSISGAIPVSYENTSQSMLTDFVENYDMPDGVEMKINAMDEMMNDELGSLGSAILTAVFLVFIVMAMQFESPRLSLMVMFTVPFSLIGAFGFLFFCNSKLNMVSMLGLLMMVGTVVNNGILYVDTVNQYRQEMPLYDALVEAGATRIRPMLMTTLTTVLAMIPMALAYGNSGEMLQGLALVNIGGLLASTLLTLLLLPTVYQMFDSRKKIKAEVIE